MRARRSKVGIISVCLVVAGSIVAVADGVARSKLVTKPEPGADVPTVDVGPVKDKLEILSDGKQHYLALIPFDQGSDAAWTHVYYGDGKSFYALRIIGSGANGRESFDFTFWEPRVKARYQAEVSFKAGKYEVQCDTRQTELAPLPRSEAVAMIAAATFHKPLWRFHAFALARDDRGTYYYVDRQREPEDSLNFRLYSGPRGAVKPLKMVNVVSDSEGQIFSTKSGDLRLVLDRHEAAWVKGKARTTLVPLPIEDNAPLIYGDLGAYTGQRLGTPCDDL